MNHSSLTHLGSTYRLQLNGLGFAGARRAVPFLAGLGVETLYVSPITRARNGSSHGYDVVDPTVIDPALGGREGYEQLLDALGEAGIRLLIDIVPNHMAASVENAMFTDVLRLGRRSRYAPVFDIAWEAADNTVVLPVLDGPLSAALDAGRIRLVRRRAGSGYELVHDELHLPLDPADDEDLAADLADFGDVKEPAARRQLELLLSHQHYRLVDWRSAGYAVNSRRFFDINDLIGVRQEDPDVFALTHRLVLELADDPRVAGVRVDHVDGLRDPGHYLAMLREALDQVNASDREAPVIVVEKILEREEELPAWPVSGTTGYEFAALTTGLFIDPAGAEAATAAMGAATGDHRSFRTRTIEAKRMIIDELFPARLGYVSNRITRAVPQAAASRANPADISVAVQELTAHLDVYRTYRRPGERLTPADRRRLADAATSAREELADREAAALDQVMSVLTGSTDWGTIGWEAVAAWQQLTPAVAAKGVEDTALYEPGTLLAGADVGTQPDQPAVAAEEFHQHMDRRMAAGAVGLNALSTHDSKRSHDVRCRLAVLSEIADRWERAVASLDDSHQAARPDAADRRYLYETLVGAWPVDGQIDETFTKRVQEHVVKAVREAKRNSSWLQPDDRYEAALQSLVTDVLTAEDSRATIESVAASIDVPGATNSLASVLLRAAAPGVPDVYQGDDLWLLALVDPDNRRPFDAERHDRVLTSTEAVPLRELLDGWRDGRVKQAVLRTALRARRTHPRLFEGGVYLPLGVRGSRADHVVAFARVTTSDTAVVVVPRLTHTLAGHSAFPLGMGVWGDTTIDLPPDVNPDLVDVLTRSIPQARNNTLLVGELLSDLPVALLIGVT
ncbi:MAG: malto-oligosyltrehalose synthase [Mycobacteriales bacterium]